MPFRAELARDVPNHEGLEWCVPGGAESYTLTRAAACAPLVDAGCGSPNGDLLPDRTCYFAATCGAGPVAVHCDGQSCACANDAGTTFAQSTACDDYLSLAKAASAHCH